MKNYFHIIEESGYNSIGTQGWYKTLAEAEAEVKKLQEFFPKCFFYVYPSNSKKQPEFITL
jgi:hypothetical protein